MYRAFNLSDCNWDNVAPEKGEILNEKNLTAVRQSLKAFLDNNKIDGSKMRDNWFPEIDADVFISHSHKDKDDAIKLAGWLFKNFKIVSFIDSCVWGCADDLLKQIDDINCLNDDKKSYSYERRNGSTSHVHMMLSTALGMMIDAAECVLFMNTPNSITSKESADKTQSPWLYYELAMTRFIRREKPKRLTIIQENFSGDKRAAEIPIEYLAELSALTPLNADHLRKWAKGWDKNGTPLDLLYTIAPE